MKKKGRFLSILKNRPPELGIINYTAQCVVAYPQRFASGMPNPMQERGVSIWSLASSLRLRAFTHLVPHSASTGRRQLQTEANQPNPP